MKRTIPVLLVICALHGVAYAQFRSLPAQVGVHNSDGTSIKKGVAVSLIGTVTASGLANVGHPAAADAHPVCVVADSDIAANSDGICYYLGWSPIQVRLASNVAQGDPLRVANTAGEWETAPLGSTNAMLVAATSGTAGTDTTWATPIAASPVMVVAPAGGSAWGITSDPTRTLGTFAVLTDLVVNLVTHGGPCFCTFSGSFRTYPGDSGYIALFADGTEVPGTRRLIGSSLSVLGLTGYSDGAHADSAIGFVSAGAHTFDLRWLSLTGTMRANGTQRGLFCRELN